MKKALALLSVLFATVVCSCASRMSPPIAQGQHTFVVRFEEHPDMTGGHLDAEVRDGHIRLTSKPDSSVFPAGLVEEGVLVWHAASKQWIIGQTETESELAEVGGCSDGPFVVDLEQKIFWTC